MYFENLIHETIEFQNRNGVNPLTIGLFVAILVFFIQAWGLLDQNKKIVKQEEKELLPVYFFINQFFYFTGYVFYGFSLHSATIVISNLSGFFMLFIIINLIKYKRINILKEKNVDTKRFLGKQFKIDIIASSLLTIILSTALLFISNKDILVITLLVVVIITILPLALGVIRAKNFKIIGIKYLLAIILSAIAWIVYGIIVSIRWGLEVKGLIISSFITFMVSTILLVLRLKFNRKNPEE